VHISNYLVIGVPYASESLLPALRSNFVRWSNTGEQTADTNQDAPVLHYSALRIKAEQAISAIEEQSK